MSRDCFCIVSEDKTQSPFEILQQHLLAIREHLTFSFYVCEKLMPASSFFHEKTIPILNPDKQRRRKEMKKGK